MVFYHRAHSDFHGKPEVKNDNCARLFAEPHFTTSHTFYFFSGNVPEQNHSMICVVQKVDGSKGRRGETSLTTRQDKGMQG